MTPILLFVKQLLAVKLEVCIAAQTDQPTFLPETCHDPLEVY
jgi:hypothetical protein